MQNDLITPKKRYPCTRCLEYAKKHFTSTRSAARLPPDGAIAGSSNPVLPINSMPQVEKGDSDLTDAAIEVEQEITETDGNIYDVLDEHMQDDPSVVSIDCVLSEILDRVAHLPKWEEYSEIQRAKLNSIAFAFGHIIESDLFHDANEVTKSYRDDLKSSLDKTDWIEDRNTVLTSFLKGCTRINNLHNVTAKKANSFVHAVEQGMYTRHNLCVTPFAFQLNVVQYILTGSKAATNLTGYWEPAGSY